MAFILPDGQFHISQLAPAVYRVLAFDRQHPELAYATEEELAQYDSQGQIIHVVAHQTEHMRTRLALITRSE